ncbi:metallophosphoesterase [Polaromonas sp. YR568]|uniref:metallophosphoesterase n=1 Tax=Polaromonas sp. YR568 TaxID=1855301 RepID=UPI00398C1AC6
MKILLLSDLHVEFAPFVPDPTAVDAADVIVLAGDISTGTQGLAWANKTFPGKPIIYIAGNHEFYHHHWTNLLLELRAKAVDYGIHFLENDGITIDDVRFLGCTLWTDFLLFGQDKKPKAIQDSMAFMNDFSEIKVDNLLSEKRKLSKLSAEDTIQRHQESLAWPQAEMVKGDPASTVVITHHYPSRRSTAPRWSNDLISANFGSKLPTEVLLGAKLWVHGHMHESCNYRIGDSKRSVRVICNPRGYPLGWHKSEFENPSFDPGLLINTSTPGRDMP